MAERLTYVIEIEAQDAISALSQFSKAMNDIIASTGDATKVGEALDAMVEAGKKADTAAGGVNEFNAAVEKMNSGTMEAKTSLQVLGQAYRTLEKEAQEAAAAQFLATGKVTSPSSMLSSGDAAWAADAKRQLGSSVAGSFAAEQKVIDQNTAATEAAMKRQVEAFRRRQAAQKEMAVQGIALDNNMAKVAEEGARRQAAAMRRLQQEHDELYAGLANTRYALYDVASTATATSLALGAFAAGSVYASASLERLMTSVERTSGVTGGELTSLKDGLRDLSTQMPVSIDDITQIATLAGQLGIEGADNIENFTQAITMFAATTNVTVDAAAEKIGRIAQLTDDANFEGIANAIYQTGVTSLATESAILAVSEQIAPVAAKAGLASTQVVALSSALASLAVAPERARGSFQRIFNEMDQAAKTGGATLDEFARISNMTASEFSQLWQNDAQGALLAFLDGLEKLRIAGGNTNSILAEVGIVAVRDVDAIDRLAQNTEVYRRAIEETGTAYASGTALTDAYAKVNDDLLSILEKLGNVLRDTFSNVPLEPLKIVLNLVYELAQGLRTVTANPVGKWFLFAAVAVTGTVAALMAAVAAGALFVASLFGIITALQGLNKNVALADISLGVMKRSVILLLASLGGLNVEMTRAAITANTFKGALTAVTGQSIIATRAVTGFKIASWATGVGLAVTAVGALAGAFANMGDTSLEASAKLDQYGESLKRDTEAFRTEDAAAFFTDEIDAAEDASDALAGNAEKSRELLGIKSQLAATEASGNKEAKSWKDASIALGEYSEQVLRQNLATFLINNNIDSTALSNLLNQLGYSVDDIIAKVKEGPQAYQAFIGQLTGDLETYWDNASRQATEKGGEAALANQVLAESGLQFAKAITTEADAMYAAAAAAKVAGVAQGNLGVAADTTNGVYDEQGNLVAGATETLLAQYSAARQLANAQNSLTGTLRENGYAFTELTVAGRENISAVEDYISTLYQQYGDSDVFRQAVRSALQYLEAQGIATAELERFYALIGGSGTPVTTFADLAGHTALVAADLRGIQEDAANAASSASSGADSTADIAENVRTIADYVNDLDSAFSNAFDIRFGLEESEDATQSIINGIIEDAENARKKARDLRNDIKALNAELKGQKADRKTLEYQLAVAELYGDEVRAAQIRAELAQNSADQAATQADLADSQAELVEVQEVLTMSTQGNSDAAIENREKLRELTQSVEDQIVAYANAGHTQEEVEAYAKKLREEFKKQALQLGYSEEDVNHYAAALDDAIAIILAVPRNVTTEYDINNNPALRAIAELKAKSKKDFKNRTATYKINTAVDAAGLKKAGRGLALYQEIIDLTASYNRLIAKGDPISLQGARYTGQAIQQKSQDLLSGNYWTGGYTGNGGTREPAGTVHGQEFVFNARATRGNVPFLNSLMQTLERGGSPRSMMGAAGVATPGVMQVELSPYDRRLLAAAGIGDVIIDGERLTTVVNKVNKRRNRTGQA